MVKGQGETDHESQDEISETHTCKWERTYPVVPRKPIVLEQSCCTHIT